MDQENQENLECEVSLNNKKEKYKFNKLTSIILDEEIFAYESALDFAYSDSEIKNIAITGVYGSGKSSVWRTYQDKKESQKDNVWTKSSVIHVSLSDFSDKEKNENKEVQQDKTNNTGTQQEEREEYRAKNIDKQILNQIMYQIDESKIPLSKYVIKKQSGKCYNFRQGVLILLAFLGISILVFRNELSMFFPQDKVKQPLSITTIIGLILLAIPTIILFVWLFNRAKVKITTVNLKVAEAKISDDEENSMLDYDIRELVYLVRASEAHTIVFEDLDRFNDMNLFIKLRELNFLVNQKYEKTVRFIYMLRDDVFVSKDRTKFFDLIIPIIPVVNSNNSAEKLKRVIEKINVLGEKAVPSDKALEGISLYLDDMRILKNICNEYVVYYDRIKAEKRGLNADKLFALITLKNVFPREFDDLQKDQGYIYNLFSKKDSEIEKENNKIEKEINASIKKVGQLKRLKVKSKYELMALFIPIDLKINNAGNQVWSEFIESWESNPDEVFSMTYSRTDKGIDYEDFVEYLERNEEYSQAMSLFNYKYKEFNNVDDEILFIKNTIKNLEDKKEQLEITNLSELLREKSEDELMGFFSSNNEENCITKDKYFRLIRFLLIDGLIGETYWHYRGYFYIGKLGNNDEMFLRKLLDGTAESPRLKLDNPKAVMESLKAKDYDRVGAFNYVLMDRLIEIEKSAYIVRVVNRLLKDNKLGLFVSYLNKKDYITFYKIINLIYKESNKQIKKIIIGNDELSEVNSKILISIYGNNSIETEFLTEFKDMISENPKILESKLVINNNDFIEGLNRARVEFITLKGIKTSVFIIQGLEQYGLFILSVENLLFILEFYLGDSQENIISAMLTHVFSNNEIKTTQKRVKIELDNVLTEYLKLADDYEIESLYNKEREVLEVLNSEIKEENKISFIKINKTKINDLSSVDDTSLWSTILEHNRLKYANDNISVYWNNRGEVSEAFIKYLNDFSQEETFNLVDIHSDLAYELINNIDISNKVFNKSLEVLENKIEEVNSELPKERIHKMLTYKQVGLTEANTLLLLDINNNEMIRLYSEQYGDDLAEHIITSEKCSDELDQSSVATLLDFNNFSVEAGIKLINKFNNQISLYEIENSSLDIRRHVFENYLVDYDIPLIIERPNDFELWGDFAEALKRIDFLEKLKDVNLNFMFVNKVIKDDSIHDDIKSRIIAIVIQKRKLMKHIPKWISEIKSINEIADVFENKKPQIENSDQIIIANALEQIGVISISYEERMNFRPTKFKKMLEEIAAEG